MIKIVGGPKPTEIRIFAINDDEDAIEITGDVQYVTWRCHAANDHAEVTLGIPLAVVDVTGELKDVISIKVGEDETT